MLPARHTQQGVQHRSTPGGRDTCVRSALARSMRGPARGAHPGRRGLPADAHVKARPRHGQVGQARLHRALQPPRRRPARPRRASAAPAPVAGAWAAMSCQPSCSYKHGFNFQHAWSQLEPLVPPLSNSKRTAQ